MRALSGRIPSHANAQAGTARGMPIDPRGLLESVKGPYARRGAMRHEAPRYLAIFPIFRFLLSLAGDD